MTYKPRARFRKCRDSSSSLRGYTLVDKRGPKDTCENVEWTPLLLVTVSFLLKLIYANCVVTLAYIVVTLKEHHSYIGKKLYTNIRKKPRCFLSKVMFFNQNTQRCDYIIFPTHVKLLLAYLSVFSCGPLIR